ncbi:MAG: AAC(3) family N-acetyltransferase [Dermatophilaceae bacterium]
MLTIDREEIVTGLKIIGLQAGDHVLVHSSLSSLGSVVGGAATVVQALLDVVTTSGTVLAPTLTGNAEIGCQSEVFFDEARTQSWTGAIAEAVRTWPGAMRSLHPTHSVAAIGAGAERLTRGHLDCLTPCGEGSPYSHVAQEPHGMILLLGCDHESNTTLHHVEELAGVPYHLQNTPVHAVICADGQVHRRTFFAHQYGAARRFAAIEALLLERGLQTQGEIGQATARLLPSGPSVRMALDLLRAAPDFFLGEASGITQEDLKASSDRR